MNRILTITFILIAIIVFTRANQSFAQPMHNEWREKAPYGNYCPGYRRGWYGAKRTVRTAEQAKRILKEYFSPLDVKIGRIKERKWFFVAEILDKNDVLIDTIIIDKRTGRIRSIY